MALENWVKSRSPKPRGAQGRYDFKSPGEGVEQAMRNLSSTWLSFIGVQRRAEGFAKNTKKLDTLFTRGGERALEQKEKGEEAQLLLRISPQLWRICPLRREDDLIHQRPD